MLASHRPSLHSRAYLNGGMHLQQVGRVDDEADGEEEESGEDVADRLDDDECATGTRACAPPHRL